MLTASPKYNIGFIKSKKRCFHNKEKDSIEKARGIK